MTLNVLLRLSRPFGSICTLILVGWVQSHEAIGACQPYKPNPDFLREIQTDEGVKRAFPRQNQEQKETVMALVKTPAPSPEQISELAQVEFWWRVVPGRMDGFSRRVRSPFEYTLKYYDYYIRSATKAEIDPDGDGKFERIPDGNRSYSYAQAGDYHPTIRIYDANGLAYTVRETVIVLAPEEFDAQIQAVWNDLNDALKRNDEQAVLDCVHTGARSVYHKRLRTTTDLSLLVPELIGPLKWVKSEPLVGATYSQAVTDEGVERTIDVRFVLDVDGVWRLRY